MVLVPNTEKFCVDCYLVCDDEIFGGDLFFCSKTNEILQCSQVGLSGIFAQEEKGFFPFTCCKKVVVKPEQIGWMWDNHPDDSSDIYLVPFIDEKDNTMIDYVLKESGGKCLIETETICPNHDGAHIGKDCSCKMGFMDVPKLYEGKAIIYPNP